MAYHFNHNNESIPIIIRKHATSRRMVVRYRARSHSIALTLPRYTSTAQGLHFIESKRAWIEERLEETPKTIPLIAGQNIPVLGEMQEIRHIHGRGVVHMEGGVILVPGAEAFVARRVKDFLKIRVRKEISALAHAKAAILGKKIGKISLRDTSSHWASCNHKGNLSFCWRLIFAPYALLDYVVAHEIAHLAHLNHSPAFWQTVALLCPEYKDLRKLLKEEGETFYRYE